MIRTQALAVNRATAARGLLTSCLVACSPAAAARSDEALPVDAQAEAALLAFAGEGFSLKRTPHFLIVYDTDEETLRDFVGRVEAIYRTAYRFMKHHDVGLAEPARRLEIFFFASIEEFQRYAERIGARATGAAGFYHPATNRAAFYDAASAPRLVELDRRIAEIEERMRTTRGPGGPQRETALRELRALRIQRDNTVETINQLVVQHEVAHQVFYNAGLHTVGADQPPWIVEGLACLFEAPPGRSGAGLGVVNQYRLLNFREALTSRERAAEAEPADYAAAVRAGRLVSLARLLGDKSLFRTSQSNVENNYALAWSLVYYLQRRQRDKLGEYLTLLAKRPAGRTYSAAEEVAQFELVFGPVDEAFAQKWLEYILELRVQMPR